MSNHKDDLKQRLTAMQYHVTQENGTEPPFQNVYDQHFIPGIYVDIVSGEALFSSLDKFDAGCGWPAFSKPIKPQEITEHQDLSYGYQRTEVRSSTADSHLGHLFEDGPQELGGLRYCINSAALRFIAKDELEREGYGEYLALFFIVKNGQLSGNILKNERLSRFFLGKFLSDTMKKCY